MGFIVAGIDEAGLGPVVGPLATASAALAVPRGWRPDSPWERLASGVDRSWLKGERRAVVSDSKILYRTGGLAAMELTLGALGWLTEGRAVPILTVLGGEAAHPCYSCAIDPFPVHVGIDDMAFVQSRVRGCCDGAGVEPVHLEAALLYEPALNKRYADGLNKNQALLMETGRHIVRLVERFADDRLLVVVDKQGGRNDYLPFLTGLFPGLWVREMEAGAESSRYILKRTGGDAEIIFRPKADRDSFVTALASLAAKYARERAMAELNAWFCDRIADLKPTAGYPGDAKRWLDDVAGRFGVEMVIRER
ncbi:MAG: hypothetical protein LUC93_18525 [Planctomycetaceae bacterium]|nr:hypothetical protein [Planctomycetaceae bacterium]